MEKLVALPLVTILDIRYRYRQMARLSQLAQIKMMEPLQQVIEVMSEFINIGLPKLQKLLISRFLHLGQ